MKLAASLILAAWPGIAAGQESAAAEPGILKIARETIEAARYCFLITVDSAGQPQARLMEPFPPERDLTVWMGTRPRSRKVTQIRRNPRASLACYNPSGPDYVTLIGKARVVDELSERERRWRPGWEAFFPGGPGGGHYVLIEFMPSRLEMISHTHRVASQPDSPGPAVAVRKGGGWVEQTSARRLEPR